MNVVFFTIRAELLDIQNASDTTWHLGLLYELPELKFSISLMKLISSFLSQRKLTVSVELEISTPRDIQADCNRVLSCPTHCTVYVSKIRPQNLVSI
jgi:hypothetical protein